MMTKRKRTILILILGLLSAIGPFSIDMYLPGFPAIARDLQTTVETISYSLSSFFIGICIGQMLWGPLLDRFGRKVPLYIGLSVYILASLGCAVSGTVEMLVFFRFFQALGGCVGMVAPRAMVRDVFPLQESAKVFSLLILILGISPIIAPMVGSFTITAYGWHSVFIVLAVITAVILGAVIFLLPESKKPDPSFSLKPKPIVNSFYSVFKTPQFYTYAMAGGVASASLMAYLSGSPFVFMGLFRLNEQQYSLIFGFIAAGLIGGSQLNNLLLRKYSSVQIFKAMLVIQTVIGLLLVMGTAAGWLHLYSLVLLIFLFLSCQGLIYPNAGALSMAPFHKEAGSASALMGALQMAFGAAASAAVGWLNNGTALPMSSVMAGCAITGLLVLIVGHRQIEYRSRQEDVEEQAFEMIEKY
jgi:MFS transporter, DHA1 family, multidrug resistance protein